MPIDENLPPLPLPPPPPPSVDVPALGSDPFPQARLGPRKLLYEYEIATGVLTGRHWRTMDTPVPRAGMAIAEASQPLHWRSTRFDSVTEQFVDYVPPQPPSNERFESVWDSVKKEWTKRETLVWMKRGKWNRIKAHAMSLGAADIVVGGYTFNADPESRSELFEKAMLAKLAADDGLPFSVAWDDANGAPVTLNANQTKAIIRAIDARADQLRATARSLRQQINAATTEAEVNAVVWPP